MIDIDNQSNKEINTWLQVTFLCVWCIFYTCTLVQYTEVMGCMQTNKMIDTDNQSKKEINTWLGVTFLCVCMFSIYVHLFSIQKLNVVYKQTQ